MRGHLRSRSLDVSTKPGTHLASLGHRLKTGTIVDASIIDAPSSTKNRRGERAEMHQTKKGNRTGMKAHIGVDASGLAHAWRTAANAGRDAGVRAYGDETEAWGDAGYQGVDKRPENRGCDVAWQVAMKPKRRLLDRDGAEAAAEPTGAGEGGASVLVCEAALRVVRCATGDYRVAARSRICLAARDRITRGGPPEGGSRTHRSDFLTVHRFSGAPAST